MEWDSYGYISTHYYKSIQDRNANLNSTLKTSEEERLNAMKLFLETYIKFKAVLLLRAVAQSKCKGR